MMVPLKKMSVFFPTVLANQRTAQMNSVKLSVKLWGCLEWPHSSEEIKSSILPDWHKKQERKHK